MEKFNFYEYLQWLCKYDDNEPDAMDDFLNLIDKEKAKKDYDLYLKYKGQMNLL